MEFGRSVSGCLFVEFTSAAPEKTLDAVSQAGIPLCHVVRKNELTYQIQIPRKDYPQLKRLLQKNGDTLKLVRKEGLYWTLKTAVHRPFLLIVFLFLLLSSFYLPSRIFFVHVRGNVNIPDLMIVAAAEKCGIRFGTSRKLVRSEKVKNALLAELPQLQWAGVNTSGCTAVISVRERAEEEKAAEKNIVSNLISDQDGYILSATITSGTPHFFPGQIVTKGQLLISGYTDCGIYIRASRAEGEILAQTNRKIKAVMLDKYYLSNETGERKYRISLLVGKKRINLWKDSSILDACCGRMYEEYYVSLPGGFLLPAAVCVDQFEYYEIREDFTTETDAQTQLERFSEEYLLQQMIAGQIIRKQQILSGSAGQYQLDGNYTCIELIGREQREQIGVINGKRN